MDNRQQIEAEIAAQRLEIAKLKAQLAAQPAEATIASLKLVKI